MQNRLEIYIERGCQNCQEAISIADRLSHRTHTVQIHLIDVGQEPHRRPETVFAVPTYILDGEILSLGNPRFEELLATLKQKSESSSDEVDKNGRYKNSGADPN